MKQGKLYDVTLPLRPGILTWPGDAPVVFCKSKVHGAGSVTDISLSVHAGTHLDAPAHMLENGAYTEDVDLCRLVGPARVVEVPHCTMITHDILRGIDFGGASRLLLKTSNSELLASGTFDKNYVALDAGAAEYVVEHGIQLMALDSLSVDVFDSDDYPVHKILLGAGVVVVEGVDLRGVPVGEYELLCLPLKLESSDGAPARVILRAL
ncbi:MAG: cyclase family protein [Dehalococcoidia bacterium]|nr:cyclase family protein [Dehalococcoidia bacterium]